MTSNEGRLQASWRLVKNEFNGETEEVPPKAFETNPSFFTLTIKNDTFKRAAEQFTFQIDPSKDPQTIDFTATEGSVKGLKFLGIYSLEGSTLKICRAVDSDGKRPKEFKTQAGSRTILSVYEKIKR
jgi:uncharacterized protein (TIGR03067 family)